MHFSVGKSKSKNVKKMLSMSMVHIIKTAMKYN